MTTHAPSHAMRKPLGMLDDSRLQALHSTKNRQNALAAPHSSPSHKRHLPLSTPDHNEDNSENVDPALFSSKRLKNLDGFESKSSPWTTHPTKRSNFMLVDASPSPEDLMITKPASAPVSNRVIAKPKSRLNRSITLGLNTTPTPTPASTALVTPSSSVSTAGRSPQNKRIGILSKRRTASPFFRIDPPTKSRRSAGLSIDAALSGTILGYAPKTRATPASSRPTTSLDEQPTKGGWFFEIHEDTPEDELTNMMQHGTCTLDISDDEDRRRAKDDRGKENIPPEAPIMSIDQSIAGAIEGSAPLETAATPAPSKKGRVHESKRGLPGGVERAPLADLAPSDFYDEALLSSTTFDFTPEITTNPDVVVEAAGTVKEPAPVEATAEEEEDRWSPSCELRSCDTPTTEPKEMQIWESGSANGDAEQA